MEGLYPFGGNEFVISEKANVATGTSRGYLTHPNQLANFTRKEKRDKGTKPSGPGKNRFNIENYSFVLNKEKQFLKEFSPGFVNYKPYFLDGWNKIIEKSEVDGIHEILVKFLRNIFKKMDSIPNDPAVKKIKPRLGRFTTQQEITKTGTPLKLTKDMKCDGCGINHEARDFIRAILLHLADLLEVNKEYIKFISEKKFLNEEARDRFLEIAEKEPIKTQRSKQANMEILYYKGEEIGKIETLLDTPQLMLRYIHKENPDLYERIVEQIGKEIPRCISKKPLYSSRTLPHNVHLRLKSRKEKYRVFDRIIKHGGYSKDDWQEIPTTK